LEQAMALVREDITGEVLLWTFFNRRIQPLRAIAHEMRLYIGPIDTTRESTKDLIEVEVDT
jgi:hypothetical protein